MPTQTSKTVAMDVKAADEADQRLMHVTHNLALLRALSDALAAPGEHDPELDQDFWEGVRRLVIESAEHVQAAKATLGGVSRIE